MRFNTYTAFIALTLTLLATAAAAQDSRLRNPETTNGFAPPHASVGEDGRVVVPSGEGQPTQQSLPSSVLREESRAARAPADPLGPLPQICKDC